MSAMMRRNRVALLARHQIIQAVAVVTLEQPHLKFVSATMEVGGQSWLPPHRTDWHPKGSTIWLTSHRSKCQYAAMAISLLDACPRQPRRWLRYIRNCQACLVATPMGFVVRRNSRHYRRKAGTLNAVRNGTRYRRRPIRAVKCRVGIGYGVSRWPPVCAFTATSMPTSRVGFRRSALL